MLRIIILDEIGWNEKKSFFIMRIWSCMFKSYKIYNKLFLFYVLDASVLMKRISVYALEKMYLWVHTYITAVKIRQRMTSKARQPKIWIILVKKHDKQTYLNDKRLLKQPWSWWHHRPYCCLTIERSEFSVFQKTLTLWHSV